MNYCQKCDGDTYYTASVDITSRDGSKVMEATLYANDMGSLRQQVNNLLAPTGDEADDVHIYPPFSN